MSTISIEFTRPRLLLPPPFGRNRDTHDTILQLDDVSMTDRLEDGNLSLEVLHQLCRELGFGDGFDGDGLFRPLRTSISQIVIHSVSQLVHGISNHV